VISGPVTFELADSAYRDRRYDDAAALFKSYSVSRPSNPWGFYMLGLSAWKSGDRVTAESAFVQAITLDPTHVKSHLNLSRVLLETEQADSALAHIETAIQLDSTSSEPVRLQGRAFEALGQDRRRDSVVSARDSARQHRCVGVEQPRRIVYPARAVPGSDRAADGRRGASTTKSPCSTIISAWRWSEPASIARRKKSIVPRSGSRERTARL
jgi:tetratricopeptide (TPR) repeat protein